MYLGLIRMGTIIMSLFAGIIAISNILYLEVIMITLPVIWFISFFQTFQLKNLSLEERKAIDAKYTIQSNNMITQHMKDLLAKRHIALGIACIFIGLWMMISNFLFPILRELELYWIMDMLRSAPSAFVAIAVIVLGVYLIRGDRKKQPKEQEDFVEYKGDAS